MVLTPHDVDDLANRPTVLLPRRPPGPRPGRAPLAVVAVANALWAAVTSLVPVLVIVAVVTMIGTERPAPTLIVRYGAASWLLGHGVPLTIGGSPLGLVPLAVTMLAVWRLVIAGRHVAKASRRHPTWIALAIGVPYGLLGLGAATYARGTGLGVSVARATATLALVATLATFAGSSAEGMRLRRWLRRVPSLLREGVRTGVAATFYIWAAGAVAAGVAIAVGGSTATSMLRNYHAGVGGQAGIIAICLVYAPNVALWAAAYLAGPGFTLGGVPQLPVFAGLPSHPVTGAGQALLAMPVLAGAAAGVAMARRVGGVGLSRWGRVGAAALGGPIAGLALGALGWAASGPLGTKLLAHTGDVGWLFPVIGTFGVAFGAAVGALVTGPREP